MTAVQKHEPAPLPVAPGLNDLLALALQEKSPVEALERLVALKEREDAKQAAREFFAAKADFQRVCPRIHKGREVSFTSKAGGKVQYTYAALDGIAETVNPLLHERGLSYSWDTAIEGTVAVVRCTLRHTAGHSEAAQFTAPTTSSTPGMSDQQRHGAAVKYAMRWSLIQVLGLVTTDDDPDTAEVDPTPLDEAQRIAIEDLLAARCEGKPAAKAEAIRARFLAFMGAGRVEDIRAADFDRAAQVLRPKGEA